MNKEIWLETAERPVLLLVSTLQSKEDNDVSPNDYMQLVAIF